jgi:tetratricopeptide (TPR) repeat protein
MKKSKSMVKFVCFLTVAIIIVGCMTAQDFVRKGEASAKFEESVKYFDKALDIDPDNIELRKSIAQEYVKKGEASTKFDESDKYFIKAFGLDPDNVDLRNSFATIYIPEIKNKKGKEREDLYKKASTLAPDNLDIYHANGYALLLRDSDFLAAAKVFEEILEKDQNYRCKEDMIIPGSLFGFKNATQFSGTTSTGIKYTGLNLAKCSLFFPLGVAHFDAANSNSKLSLSEKNNAWEKSLHYLQKGYDIDIRQGRNNTQEAKILYLLQMARTAERMEDYATAIQYYTTFLNDNSIKFDKAGISEKRQPLYAKVGQSSPAVVSSSQSNSNPASNQQNRPTPVDWTNKTEYTHAVDVGGVYRLRFSASDGPGALHMFAMNVPPYVKTVTVFTEGDLDTVIEWGGIMSFTLEFAGRIKRPTDMVIVENQSPTNRNAHATFPTIPVFPTNNSKTLEFTVSEKNGRTGEFIVIIQGSR